MAKEYDHKKIEKKWQKAWVESSIYRTEEKAGKPKSYVLDMFPYPSGEGLHVGHPKGYIATDIYSRTKRMQGHSILHPMGWDAFGLPAENFAIKNKVHPRVAVEKNVARFKEQLEKIGFNYDWSREINTTDPGYYKWTQWIFLKMFEKGLAYESHEPINWCPSCQTGLANEDLEDGKCERCGSVVEKRPMRQWILKITDYAERMLKDLDLLPEWPEHIKESQRNWIGKSEGVLVTFLLADVPGQKDGKHNVEIFTTRPDTMFGATYVAVSPELAKKWIDVGWQVSKEVSTYIENALKERVEAGIAGAKEKTGIETGIRAINPANDEKIPVWVANYVLGDVGTGAIMAVPAHDERDFEFAKKYNIPIHKVIEPLTKRTIGPDTVRDNEPFEHREMIVAILKHWSEDKYLGVKWGVNGWQGFFTGGILENESPEVSGAREIKEESGYLNVDFKGQLGGEIHAQYYQTEKKVNRFAHMRVMLYQLRDDERIDTAKEEKKLHEFVWLTPEQLDTWVTHADMKLVWNRVRGVECYTGEGMLVNSGTFGGLHSEHAKIKITEKVGGKMTTTYRLKDWVFSRQRYWGEPIPIIHCEKCGVISVPEKDLPVVLPEVEHYEPTGTGESPLANISEWVNVTCPKCGGAGKRETNTMPQWAGSCWYYLRYMDSKNDKALVDSAKEKYWAPVDVYVGGAEHATRHLIYARFWHKFLRDIGVVSTEEPFNRLISVGLITAEDGKKMSKRYGNVINPDDIVETWGADTLRLYEMFMGPFTDSIAWSTQNMIGVRRFLERVWRVSEKVADADVAAIDSELHRTIKKVGEDIEAFKFNTAISQMMIFMNAVEKAGSIGKNQWTAFLKILAPFAPHMADELWSAGGNTESIHTSVWPTFDSSKLMAETAKIAVQVNGKLRGVVEAPMNADENAVKALVEADAKLAAAIAGKTISRTFFVANRLINFLLS